MPLAPETQSAIRRALSASTELSPAASFEAKKQELGFLGKLGRFVDTPGRFVRSALTGKRNATGRDLTDSLGITTRGINKPGLDIGDVAGFGLEVATDPLTFLGGIGVASKAGKASSRLTSLLDDLPVAQNNLARASRLDDGAELLRAQESLRQTEDAISGLRQLGTDPLADGFGAQVRKGQRDLLSLEIPFTDTRVGFNPLGREFSAKFLQGAQDLGRFTTGANTGKPRALFRLFDPGTFTGNAAERADELSGFGVFPAEQGPVNVLGIHPPPSSAPQIPPPILPGVRLENPLGQSQGPAFISQIRPTAGLLGKQADSFIGDQTVFFKDSGAERFVEDFQRKKAQAAFDKFEVEEGIVSQAERLGVDRTDPRLASLRESLDIQTDAARDRRLHASAEEIEFVARLRDSTDRTLAEMVRRGARSKNNAFHSEVLAYMERVLTPQAKEYFRNNPNKVREFLGRVDARLFTTKEASQIRRKSNYYNVLTAELDEFLKKERPLPDDAHWFQFDPARSVADRFESAKVAIAAADMHTGMAEKFMRAFDPTKDMPLGEFLLKGPLHSFRGKALGGTRESVEAVLRELGLSGRGIPIAVGERALQVHRRLVAPEEISLLGKVFDQISGIWKASFTIPFPNFHFRNLFSDATLSALGGGASPSQFARAIRIASANPDLPETVRKVLRTAPTPEDLEEYRKWQAVGIGRGASTRTLLEEADPSLDNPLARRIFERFPGSREKFQTFAKKGGGMARFGEDVSRIWHALSVQAKHGLTDVEAARDVRKWLLDYGELTDFEKTVMRRGVFFYNWPRKVLPRLLEAHLTKTNRMVAINRIATQPTLERDTPLPDFIRRSGAIPAGVDAEGSPRFLTGLGLPIEELNKFDFSGPAGPLREGARTIGQNLNPLLRIPAELASGRSFFFDQDLLDLNRAEPILSKVGLAERQDFPGGGTRFTGDPITLFGLSSLPSGRFIREGNRLADVASEVVGGDLDPRQGASEQLINFLTGARTHTIDPARQLSASQESIQERLKELLRTGETGRFPLFFATEKGKANPEVLALLEQLRQVGKQRRELLESRS